MKLSNTSHNIKREMRKAPAGGSNAMKKRKLVIMMSLFTRIKIVRTMKAEECQIRENTENS